MKIFDFVVRVVVIFLIRAQSLFPFVKFFFEVVTPPGCGQVCLDDPVWKDKFHRNHKVYVFCDWYTLAPRTFSSHKSWVLSTLMPTKEAGAKIQSFVNQLRTKQPLLVGMVVRREDYSDYMGGKYFFSMEEYRALADRMVSLFRKKSIRFFICSIDEEDCSVFSGLNFVYRSGHPIENLYTLSECDYLISPPSTFAMWASLVGATPALFAESADIDFTLEDFSSVAN